jgi:hypothetical protein
MHSNQMSASEELKSREVVLSMQTQYDNCRAVAMAQIEFYPTVMEWLLVERHLRHHVVLAIPQMQGSTWFDWDIVAYLHMPADVCEDTDVMGLSRFVVSIVFPEKSGAEIRQFMAEFKDQPHSLK